MLIRYNGYPVRSPDGEAIPSLDLPEGEIEIWQYDLPKANAKGETEKQILAKCWGQGTAELEYVSLIICRKVTWSNGKRVVRVTEQTMESNLSKDSMNQNY